jgi:hypothetical protein
MAKPKKPTQADYRRKFGDEVCSYFVVESAAHPGEIQINQYASRLIGPLTPAKARELAANLIAGADAVEDDLDAATICSTCGGPLMLLGALGSRTHYRCRNCGLDSSTEGT